MRNLVWSHYTSERKCFKWSWQSYRNTPPPYSCSSCILHFCAIFSLLGTDWKHFGHDHISQSLQLQGRLRMYICMNVCLCFSMWRVLHTPKLAGASWVVNTSDWLSLSAFHHPVLFYTDTHTSRVSVLMSENSKYHVYYLFLKNT